MPASTARLSVLSLALFAAGIIVMVFTPAPAGAGEDLSPVLPADTKAYLRVGGPLELLEELETLPLMKQGGILRQCYMEHLMRVFREIAGATEFSEGRLLEAFHSIGGIHAALFDVNPREGSVDVLGAIEISQPEVIDEFIAAYVSEQSSYAGQVGETVVWSLPTDSGQTLFYATGDTMLFVATRPERIEYVLNGLVTPPEICLAKLPKYRDSLLATTGGTTLEAWVDLHAMLRFAESNMRGRELQEFKQISRIIELWRLKGMHLSSGNGQTRARVAFSPGHRWLSAIRGEPGKGLVIRQYIPTKTPLFCIDNGSIKGKISALRALLNDEKLLPEADEARGDILELEQQLGMTLDEVAAGLGGQWGFFLTMDEKSFQMRDRDFCLLVEIGEQEAFQDVWDRFMSSPVMGEVLTHTRVMEQEYRGAKVLSPGSIEKDEQGSCLGVHERVLILSGSPSAFRAAVDARMDGLNTVDTDIPTGYSTLRYFSKAAAMDLFRILIDEREFTPLLDLTIRSPHVVATLDEQPGRLDLTVNQPAAGFFLYMLGGDALRELHRSDRTACERNLRAIHDAIERYRAEKGEEPVALKQLVPDFLPQSRLRCPLHRTAGGGINYRHTRPRGDAFDSWSIHAWCDHRLHGRLVLHMNGDVQEVRERSFLRELMERGLKPK